MIGFNVILLKNIITRSQGVPLMFLYVDVQCYTQE